jgi:hypothetical protein
MLICSYSVWLFPDFLPRGLRSTAMTSWSGLCFRVLPEWFRWLLSKWPLPLPCLSWLQLGKRSFSSCSSTAVVGRLRLKSWYVFFEKMPFWKQRMTSSSVILALVARVLKKRRVWDLRISFISCFTWHKSWRVPARIMNPCKLSMKVRLRFSHELMEFGLRLSNHVRGTDSRATWK